MIKYGRQRGTTRPQEIEITASYVFIASNITPFEEELDGRIFSGYEYDYIQYSKDEYIAKLHQDVIDTQLALCDLYETIEG